MWFDFGGIVSVFILYIARERDVAPWEERLL